jgi:hypothetical protein
MKNGRIIRSFSDLRAAIAEIATETPPGVVPPMSAQQVRDAAQVFAARHQREAARVVRRTPPPNVVPFKPSGTNVRIRTLI